jgi:hypothetical protein
MNKGTKALIIVSILAMCGAAFGWVEVGGVLLFPGIQSTGPVTFASDAGVGGNLTVTGKLTLGDQFNMTAAKKICFDGATNCYGNMEGDVNGVISLGAASLFTVGGADLIQTTSAAEIYNNGSSLAVYVNDAEGLCVGNGTNNQSIPTECDGITRSAMIVSPTQTHNVPNDGAGSAPATTLTPTSSVILIDYDDVTNASVGTISETGAREGQELKGCHTGAGGTVVFTEVAGQQEIGASACTLALSDCFEAVYINASWHFLSCRDN